MSKRTKQKKAKVTKVRGFGLSFVVILILLHGIFATILYGVLRTDTATIDRPWVNHADDLAFNHEYRCRGGYLVLAKMGTVDVLDLHRAGFGRRNLKGLAFGRSFI